MGRFLGGRDRLGIPEFTINHVVLCGWTVNSDVRMILFYILQTHNSWPTFVFAKLEDAMTAQTVSRVSSVLHNGSTAEPFPLSRGASPTDTSELFGTDELVLSGREAAWVAAIMAAVAVAARFVEMS